MADKAIGDLDRSDKLYTADLIPIEQGGNAKAINGAVLAAFARERGAQAAEGAESYAEAAEQSAQKAEACSKHPPYIGTNGNWWVYDVSTERFVDSGIDASITIRIADITMLAKDAAPYVTNTGTATDPVFHLFLPIGATGNGIQSIHFNADYTLTITCTNGTSYKTGVIRGAAGNSIANVQLNPDYTLTIHYTDGNSDTTASIRGEKGETGNAGVSPVVTITSLPNGKRITITDAAHPSGQSCDVFNGDGAGDMVAAVYDPDDNVAAAGGIAAFIEAAVADDAELAAAIDAIFSREGDDTDDY